MAGRTFISPTEIAALRIRLPSDEPVKKIYGYASDGRCTLGVVLYYPTSRTYGYALAERCGDGAYVVQEITVNVPTRAQAVEMLLRRMDRGAAPRFN